MSEIDIARYLLRKASGMDPPYQKRPLANVLPLLGSVNVAEELLCRLCGKQQTDPRVLNCFHSFCLSCLQEHYSRELTSGQSSLVESCDNVSGCSTGYESDVASHKDSILCPTCGHLDRLPASGVNGLLPHYVLQHRILLASLNQETVAFYCDLCSTDIAALARCSECLVNLCAACLDIHRKQPRSALHKTGPLHSASSSKNVITAVSRQILCPSHPDTELSIFCTDCLQVVCKKCCTMVHRGHRCDIAERAAKIYKTRVRDRVVKAKLAQKEAKQALDALSSIAHRVQARCAQVEADIDRFIDGYKAALEEHGRQLRAAVSDARATKLQVIEHHRKGITRGTSAGEQPVTFAEDLLSEGSPVELLMFAVAISSRLESCEKAPGATLPDIKVLETINLLPEEKAISIMGRQLYGVVTTQRVSPLKSSIHPDSLSTLNNARQQQSCEVVLVTRDSDGQPVCHGGEHITATLCYRDITRRCIPVFVRDNLDGTYIISFTPDAAGNMSLSLSITGTPVNGSPYGVCVRTLQPHHGTFHCCSFCSSSGKKQAKCGCGGTMPGGFKGCGHGHLGHPGRRHWSCCGNTMHNSECGRPPPTFYHLTL